MDVRLKDRVPVRNVLHDYQYDWMIRRNKRKHMRFPVLPLAAWLLGIWSWMVMGGNDARGKRRSESGVSD